MFSRSSLYTWLFISVFLCSFSAIAVAKLIELPVPEKAQYFSKRLTLRDAIFLALRTNPNVRIAYLRRISDKFSLEIAHNLYVPQYTFNANTNFQVGSKPQYSYSPQMSLLTPIGTKLQLNLNQNYLGSGGSGSSITGTITQPLMQGFGPAVTMAPLVQAEYSEHTYRLNLKNTIITTITQVIQNYYTLVQAYNSLAVDQLALKDSMERVEQYRISIKAGRAAPLELAPQESQLASQRLEVTQDQNSIQQAYQALLTTLGLDPRSKLEIDKNIYIDNLIIPPPHRSVDLALENNIEYLQAVYQLKQDEVELLLAKDANRWTLNLVATKTIIPNAGASTATMPLTTGDTTPSGSSVQFNLTVPINNKSLQQRLVNAKVMLQQQQIQLAETRRALKSNIITAIQTLKFQQQQIKQAEAAVRYAQQAYDVEVIKLKYGRSTLLNVTQLQTSLTEAKQTLIAQKIDYINSLATFEGILGISLDKWGIQIYY